MLTKKYFMDRVVKSGSCWLWNRAIKSNGYGRIRINTPGKPRVSKRAHRVSYEFFKGPIPEGMCVLHKCDVRACIRPIHLFLGTVQDNVYDMVKKGRGCSFRGEANGYSKLNSKKVIQIRSSGLPIKELAQKFGVSVGTVKKIRSRHRWAWL